MRVAGHDHAAAGCPGMLDIGVERPLDASDGVDAQRADLRKFGNLTSYRKVGNWLLDKTIKYGYQTWRAGVGLVVLFVVFLALAVLG